MAKAKSKAKKKSKTPAPKKAVKKAAPVKAKLKTAKAPVKSAKPAKLVKASKPAAAQKSSLKNFITPLDDRLIVERAPQEKKTAGGLFIPDTADISGNFEGTVLAAGRGHRDPKGRIRPMDVKTGDCVIFSQYAGTAMDLHGQKFVVLREAEVLGIINK